jgi:hypothetical protein
MKPLVHDNPCAKQPEVRQNNASRRARSFLAAKALAFGLTISYACSPYISAEGPAAPARTARISSEQGKVGQWLFRRFDSGYEFLNEDFGTSIFVGRSMVTIRRPSPSNGNIVESNISLGEINLESVGASSPQGALTLTFPALSGKVYEITLQPSGENPDVRAFVRSP